MPSAWAVVSLLALTASIAQIGFKPIILAQVQSTPAVAASGPEQPIPFSHKQHAGTLQLSCEFCHTPSKSGATLVIPQAAVCMQCHQAVATTNPGVQKLANYAKTNATIPWVRVYELPSFVSFSHRVHMEHGNKCTECHGEAAQQERIYKATNISMAGCINCHRQKQAAVECDTCHTLAN
jgi:predicted CXXCH cytochrome family protein